MKKVGLYVPDLSEGGAERVVSRLSMILSKCYEVYVILNENEVLYDVGCEIINLNISADSSLIKKVLLPIHRAKKLKIIKQKYHLDCVISFLTNANIVNILSSTSDTSTILSVRNFSVLEKNESFLSRVNELILKVLCNKANFVIPVSIALQNSLAESYKIPHSKMLTIYNPYDIAEINRLSSELIEDSEHKKFLSSGKVFVTVGRLTYQKGYWHLIKAFSMLSTDSNAKLIIMGTGENQSKIQGLIKQLNLEEKVLLAGYQKNPFKYISRSYAYVQSSLFEGFPNAMSEAMACGCPVIATDCKSGPREILFQNADLNRQIKDIEIADYGIIIPELSVVENWELEQFDDGERKLARAMRMLLDNENLRNYMCRQGKKRVKLFNYQVCMENYRKVIESCTNG